MKKIYILLVVFLMVQQFGMTQCYPDRHSTNFFDGWISCEVADNPNAARGKSHFIMYNYGKLYELGQTKIWNINDPSHLDWGMQDVAIDYSADGETWTEAGIFTFQQASGLSTYEGSDGPDLNGIEAQYLLITGISNFGSNDCFGLGEIKISAEEVVVSAVEDIAQLDGVGVTVYPNPFAEKVTLHLSPGCNGELRISIYDGLGKIVAHQTVDMTSGQPQSLEFGQEIPAGSYLLRLEHEGKSIQRSIVKINRT
jgi:hypothetical protein